MGLVGSALSISHAVKASNAMPKEQSGSVRCSRARHGTDGTGKLMWPRVLLSCPGSHQAGGEAGAAAGGNDDELMGPTRRQEDTGTGFMRGAQVVKVASGGQ